MPKSLAWNAENSYLTLIWKNIHLGRGLRLAGERRASSDLSPMVVSPMIVSPMIVSPAILSLTILPNTILSLKTLSLHMVECFGYIDVSHRLHALGECFTSGCDSPSNPHTKIAKSGSRPSLQAALAQG